MKVLRELSSLVEVQNVHKGEKREAKCFNLWKYWLPQHLVKEYKLYLSKKTDNYVTAKSYDIPELKPGQRAYIEIDDLYNGGGIITVVRPTGYAVTLKSFY